MTEVPNSGTDAVSLRQSAEALRQSEEQLRILIQSVRDYAIIMLDPAGHVVHWNEGAERIKGYNARDILGKSFKRFYEKEAVDRGWPDYELEVASREGRFEDEGWRVRKDGSRFWANVSLTRMQNSNGELIGFAKITRDLTARREAEEHARRLAAEEAARAEANRRSEELAILNAQLQEQARELQVQTNEARLLAERLRLTNLELHDALAATKAARDVAERSAAEAIEAYRELDQFAYVASHDLKAPLRAIANLAQWIQDDVGDELDEDSKDNMRLLQGRVRRMEALIDGILAYSRAGRTLNAPETVDPDGLIREVLEILDIPRGFAIEVRPGAPEVEAERVPLQQVFMNLIGNAIKYTNGTRPDPKVRIDWSESDNAVEFSVSDNGPGIAPEFHERIWGIFQTLAARDKVEGTGIGLSLVKKIVETRGGSVLLESEPGKGSTFRFSWPKSFEQGGRQ